MDNKVEQSVRDRRYRSVQRMPFISAVNGNSVLLRDVEEEGKPRERASELSRALTFLCFSRALVSMEAMARASTSERARACFNSDPATSMKRLHLRVLRT